MELAREAHRADRPTLFQHEILVVAGLSASPWTTLL
jgi:hypothetical protein